ncbi:P pilus assembly chaperone PapD [Rahnella sp. BIGb0603]|jgi:P pilus assembly chaperone PapD|uniref:fimbrial biogenesis chaperone n=1 Tax=Rahnella sp. BIGb0603 TaxID=2940612 RepID=UPI002169DE3D|nr:molecular chaperone [Rahnella sp. BIGb0603]MCS3424434.1 P pilus assembly chaperone PapD [Rahnella sp. BIGb0603]
MKLIPSLLTAALLFSVCSAHAGVLVGGTRMIYSGAKKESSLSVNNPDTVPYLIQSWVETPGSGAEKAPFIITPPLFRLDGGQDNVLRVVRAGGDLPENQESLYWLNIKSIPSSVKQSEKNTLLVAVKTRIKLIYRPQGIKGVPEDMAQSLKWQVTGKQLKVINSTPFYMNFLQVKLGNTEVNDATYVAPMSSASFALPAGVSGNNVQWKIISDYGGIGPEHSVSL